MDIRSVAVLGAGVMGSGIAAQVANAGLPVLLLDLASDGAGSRSAIAEAAVERMLRADPSPFMHPRNAGRVRTGNLDDDLARAGECDWIIEAVVERAGVKRALYERLDAVRKPGSVVSSNTSTIRLAQLTEDMPESFRRDFLITHFFNPPRFMRLLERVVGPDTRAQASAAIRDFCDRALGKGVVECKDTPGFIGNRIGVYWLQCAVCEAFDMGIEVEEADALIGRRAGIPKTGVFGLLDLVGLDLMPHVLDSLQASLPHDDPFREYFRTPQRIVRMVEEGYTGRKGKGGFYRLRRDGDRRVKEALDLARGEYREVRTPSLPAVEAAKEGGLRALLDGDGRDARYAWTVLGKTLAYAASRVPEIAGDVVAVDEAMKLGYGWRKGPFELIDELGARWLAERLARDGRAVPALLERAGDRTFYRTEGGRLEHLGVDGTYRAIPRPEGVLLLGDVKRAAQPLEGNGSASLWDLGDGVLCLEFHTRGNSIDPDLLDLIERAVERVAGQGRALVLHNEGSHFSVGANLGLALFAANAAAWDRIEAMVRQGQQAFARLREAPFPVVGAPSGMALGGGCEVLLHCDAVVAHAETYMGLVETGVGLLPAWGGCAEMLARWRASPQRAGGPMPPVSKVFETVSMATVAKSAEQAKDLLFLRPHDEVVMNRDRVLAAAKARALALADGYRPPPPQPLALPGRSGAAALDLAVDAFAKAGKATRHDRVVATALARVLSGGDADLLDELSGADVRALEREQFMTLIRHPDTLARVEHMLETGRPLRN